MLPTAYLVGVGLAIAGCPRDAWLPAVGTEVGRFVTRAEEPNTSATREAFSASHDGSRLLIVHSSGEAAVWTTTGKKVARLDDTNLGCDPAGFTADGKEVFGTGGFIAQARWDAVTGKLLRTQWTVEEAFGWRLISTAYRWLIPRKRPGEDEEAFRLRSQGFGVGFGFVVAILHPWITRTLDLTPDGRLQVLALTASDIFDPRILVHLRVWDAERGEVVRQFTPARWTGELYSRCRPFDQAEESVQSVIQRVEFEVRSHFPRKPVTADDSTNIPIPIGDPYQGSRWFRRIAWTLADLEHPRTLADQLAVNCLLSELALLDSCKISADGRYLVSGSSNAALVVWDLTTGRSVVRIPTGWVETCAFSPDGKTLLVVEYRPAGQSVICHWEIATGRRLWESPAVYEEHRKVSFSPDGRRALVTGRFRGVSLLDVETGKLLGRIGHAGREAPGQAVFLGDGRRVATVTSSCDGEKRVQIWQLPKN